MPGGDLVNVYEIVIVPLLWWLFAGAIVTMAAGILFMLLRDVDAWEVRKVRATFRAILFGALVCALPGCASPIATQATIIEASAGVLASAGDEIESRAYLDASACADVPCVDALRPRWAPVDAALDATRSALVAWLAGVSAARAGGAIDLGALAGAFAAAYADLARALDALGVSIPAIPGVSQ